MGWHFCSCLSRHRENAYSSGLPSHREGVYDLRGAPDALQVDTIMRVWLSRHRENAYCSGLPSHREGVYHFRGAPDALQVDTIMRAYRPCYRRDGTAGTSAAGYLDIEKMPTTLGYHRFQNDACWLLAAGRRLSRYVFAARRIPARSRSTNLWRTSKSLDPVPREGGGNS